MSYAIDALKRSRTVTGQDAQVMPGTESATVFMAARPGAEGSCEGSQDNESLHDNLLLIKQRHDVREAERDQHQGSDDPENELVDGAHLRYRAHLAGLAGVCRTEDAASGK